MERKWWFVLCQGCSPWWEGPSEVVCSVLPLTACSPQTGALCAMCCCFCPSQAEDRSKKSDSMQPSLWPAALGHEATAQPRMGSGSSSSPCTPAPQRALLVQVLHSLGRAGVVLGTTGCRGGWVIGGSSAAFRARHTDSPSSSMGLCGSLSIPAVMGYYYEIRLYYPKCFLNSLLIWLGMSFR